MNSNEYLTDRNDNKSISFSPYLQLAISAAQSAGRRLAKMLGQVSVREKNRRDFVTDADLAAQQLIRNAIAERFPDHRFLGEEPEPDSTVGLRDNADSEYCWIVDPLDGTTNYVHQLRSFSVSIALQHRGEFVVGCVHDPLLDETYWAEKDGGAFLNGQPICASGTTNLREALLAVSLPTELQRGCRELEYLTNVLVDTDATVRRLGSTALNLCYVGCGRLDGYWATNSNIWDVAAGVLILREAGARIDHLLSGPLDLDDLQFLAAATTELQQELAECFSIK